MSISTSNYDYYHTREYNSANVYRSTKEIDARRWQRSDESSALQRRQKNVEKANYVWRKEWEMYKKARVMSNDDNYYFWDSAYRLLRWLLS